VIFSEWNFMPTIVSARANLGLRAVLMADFNRVGIELLPVSEQQARKQVGVDQGRKLWPEEEDAQKKVKNKKRDMKYRVRFTLERMGLKYATDDEADAAVLLIAAPALVEIGDPQKPKPTPDPF